MMGRKTALTGSWKQELGLMETGFTKLEQMRSAFQASATLTKAPLYKPSENIDYYSLFKITHQPVTSCSPGKSVTVRIKTTSVNGLKWIRLLYRDVNQYEEYKTLEMKDSGNKDEYEAIIPGEAIKSKWDLMYLVEIMDLKNHGIIYPDLNKETPYVVVKVAH